MWVQAHSAGPENESGPLGRMRGGSGAKLPCRALALALISACSVPAAAWSPSAVGQLGLKCGDALGAGRGAASVTTKGRAPAAGCSISMLGRRDVIAGAVAAGIAAPAWADGAKVEKIASKVKHASLCDHLPAHPALPQCRCSPLPSPTLFSSSSSMHDTRRQRGR